VSARRTRWGTLAAAVVLGLGVLVLVAAAGQRIAAEIGLAQARQSAQAAAAQLDEATARAVVAADASDTAEAGAAQAERERAAAQQSLAADQARVAAADHAGRLASVEELATIGGEQADRFDAMNAAALVGDVPTYNRLVRQSNAAIERSNALLRALVAADSGLDPSSPVT
jgi:hypothetical protein